MTPRPEPLRVPVKESERVAKTPGELAKVGDVVRCTVRWPGLDSTEETGKVVLDKGAAGVRIALATGTFLGVERADIHEIVSRAEDADRFAVVPPPPKTLEEALALMRDGWWMEHRSLDVRRIHEGREQIRFRGNSMWTDSRHAVGMCKNAEPTEFTRTYVTILPEPSS